MSESEDESSSGADWPITEEWLQAVLREHHKDLPEPGSITVLDFSVRPGCASAESVLSNILAVGVKYCMKNDPTSASHCLSFIVKLLPQDPFSRFFVTEAQFDLREIKFYTDVVPDLQKFKTEKLIEGDEINFAIPKCYYAHYSPGVTEPEPSPPESVLVLENIKPKGYAGVDFAKGLTLTQTTSAIESIAYIHALSLSFKVIESVSITEKYSFLFQTKRASDSYQQLVERGLPQLFQFLEQKIELKNILNELNEIRPFTKEIIEALLSPQEPLALITHTDFWCNNLMFTEKDNTCQCIILDWQMVTYSRATNDLALLLTSSLPTDLRREKTEHFLDLYWETLTHTCKQLGLDIEEKLDYDRKKLNDDYKKSQLLALLLCIGSVDLAIGNAQMENRLLEFLKDLSSEGLLNADFVKTPKE